MIRKLILTILIPASSLTLCVYAAVEGKPFKITASIIESFLLSPDHFLEESGSGDKKIVIKKRILRSYMGSPSGLVRYGSIIASADAFAGSDPEQFSAGNTTSLQKISGIPVFTKTENNDTVSMSRFYSQRFSYVNPDFVRWAFRYCIPDPSMKVAGVTCRDIYRVVFSRLFRMLTEARLLLVNEGIYEKEIKAYSDEIPTADFMGVFYLENRFASRLGEYQCTDQDVLPPYQPWMAIGFWLRRGMDGSSDEIWRGITGFMERYDREWFNEKTGGR